MTTLYRTMLGVGIIIIVGLLFAVFLAGVRRGQKPPPDTTPKEFTAPTCPKCGAPITQGKPCPKCGAPGGQS